jgi:protein-disulfide isomerase
MAEETTRRERRATARVERQERERADAIRARQRRRLWQLGGAVALAAAIIVAIVLATGSGGDSGPKLRAGETVAGSRDAAALFAGIPQRGITLGNPRAPVTFVEFADLQCPFCRDYTAQVLPSLVNQYVKDGRVKMEFRNFTILGTDSVRAAQMAEAVALQNRMWNFIDVFYANQATENTGYVTDAFLQRIGRAVPGVDVTRAMNDRGIASVQRALQEAQTDAANNGFQSTPSFLVGPTGGQLRELRVSAFEVRQFTGALDKALAQAR